MSQTGVSHFRTVNTKILELAQSANVDHSRISDGRSDALQPLDLPQCVELSEVFIREIFSWSSHIKLHRNKISKEIVPEQFSQAFRTRRLPPNDMLTI